MAKKVRKCCICSKGMPVGYYGNNPEPIKISGVCCDECNRNVVIPARLVRISQRGTKEESK